ncbi:MAG: hemolysin family protein [Bacilli bacterium]|jgi:CBS domain containing-hemolysin-like protein|nr:hemolysin family protein [Bacilli bacterium]MCH4210629.1 hemolysin family protein [Bacilli bacterium]MCH4228780.1 hemolysin family protein [Bacilli bacterium]MCH4278393.1 hemolysin family protein [Bacilli bacterium]MCI2055077.1 hemolysin family protein [Bacilli bacterium]
MKTIDIVYIIVLLVLLALSSLYSASDMAYSSVNKLRLEKKALLGDEASKKALKYANDYDKTIATILFGNDFVNILASSLMSLLARDVLAEYVGESMAVTIGSLVLLLLLLIFGEISPKALAKAHSFAFSRHLVRFVKCSFIIFFPFVYPSNKLAEKIASPLIEKAPIENDSLADDDELQAMVEDIKKEGIIDEEQSKLINRSIDFKETSCYEIMTPRVKVFGYDSDEPFQEFLKNPNVFRHSRIPVYKSNLDHVLGYIPVKTLLRVLTKGEKPSLDSLILPIVSVPRTMNISSTMALMKETHHHIAVVRDEFGGTEGIITLEDILEELVGEMYDEKDKQEPDIVEIKKNVYKVKGTMNIDDFFALFQVDPDKLQDTYTTVGGYIVNDLGRFAKVGDKFKRGNLSFQVTECDEYSVKEAIVSYKKSKSQPKKKKGL